MAIDRNIEQILNGDGDFNSILSSNLLIKIVSSINGLNGVIGNIRSQSFTTDGIWNSPEREICWAIAIGIGGGGGGGGGLVNLNATPLVTTAGSQGGTTFFGSTPIAVGGLGGAGAQVNPDELGSYPRDSNNRFRISNGFNYGEGGRGGFSTLKPITVDCVATPQSGQGGLAATYEIKVLKDLTPSTGYPITLGKGGAAGSDNSTVPDGNSTIKAAQDGEDGALQIIYSGV